MTGLEEQVRRLADRKGVVILAHYYQTMDIQRVADVVGDSFELARRAAASDAGTLCLCGVRFMAEGIKILSPEKRVLFPVWDAGCPMADMVTADDVRALRAAHPGAAVVCYVNSTAEVKAASDICCTSSSAERIVRGLAQETVIFVPDRNLGAYVASRVPEKKIVLFDGYCPIHHRVTAADVARARAARPEARLLVHPECPPEVVALADGVGSTSWILSQVENAPGGRSFLIGTETGVLQRLRVTAPDKEAWLLRDGFVCPNMKKTTLEDVRRCLEEETPEMTLPQDLMDAARQSLQRMIAAV